jgi:hypothetical protein
MLSKTVTSLNPFIVRLPLSETKRGVDIWAATVAFMQKEKGIYTGVALRSPKDPYDGTLGERIAVGRAANEETGWYATWDMLSEKINVPEIPVALYRFWAGEVAQAFVSRNIHKDCYIEVANDLGLRAEFRAEFMGYMDAGDYTEWFEQEEEKILKHVYG